MNDLYSKLEAVISDDCHWHWWNADLPSRLLLEFVGVALYLPPTDPTSPPSNHYGLFFDKPRTIQFLNFHEGIEGEWPERLRLDQMRGGRIYSGGCAVGDLDHVADILSRAVSSHVYFQSDEPAASGSSQVACAFQTNQGTGAFVIAERVTLVSAQGEIPLNRVPQMRQDWWSYWKRWWKLCRTPQRLPHDNLCAGRFPAGPIEED